MEKNDKSMTESYWKYMTFLHQMKQFHHLSTDAPIQYSEALGIQLLGHAMGYEPVNLIQPGEVRHNCYLALVGKSTLTRKTTSQTFGSNIYPYSRRASEETSPEQLVVKMSKKPEILHFMPEWSAMLKGIRGKGYMARFAEVYNDLFGCPEVYERELRKRKGQENLFRIEKAYLSLNTTITPEMLKKNLTEELMYGGYMPRHLIVYGDPSPRPRGRLDMRARDVKDGLRNTLKAVLNIKDKEAKFILSDDALGRYHAIEEEALEKYERVSAFVGRYMNYVVSFADILLVSDALGKSAEKGYSPYKWARLVELVELISLIELDMGTESVKDKFSGEKVSEKWLSNLYKINNYTNRPNYLIVASEYISRAWEIIQPCLDYVLTLADYVDLEEPVAKLMDYMRHKKYASHSEAMRNTNLTGKKMEIARQTLVQRGNIRIEYKEHVKDGRTYKPAYYRWVVDAK